MRFLDLFSGIGGFRLGMEQAGHECVGWIEIDEFARKSYEAIHNTEGEWTAYDITSVTDDDIRHFRGQVDVICGGFPCQAFSIAGKRGGFNDTRGTSFFEIIRFANIIRPRYLFLENVKGLLNHARGDTFETILRSLDECGYDAEWQVLNSKDFGVPQNRERVFIIGHLRGQRTRKVFPIAGENNETIKVVGMLDIKGNESMRRVYDVGGIPPTLTTMQGGNTQPKIVQAVLTPDREKKRQNGRRMKEPGEPMFTLTAQDRRGVAVLRYVRTEYGKQIRKQYEAGEIKEKIGNMRKLEPRTDGLSNTITTVEKDNYLLENYRIRNLTAQDRHGVLVSQKTGVRETEISNCLDASYYKGLGNNQERIGVQENYRIRRLTPRECWRLQGFPDWAFDRAAAVNSDSQLYKQAGNSVTVNVIFEIAKRLGGK